MQLITISDTIHQTRFEEEIQNGELTTIHIIAYPSKAYGAGWWINLIPDIFIRPVGTNDVLKLVFAFNIPLSPERHYFRSINDSLKFTLFFPALPKDCTHIDVIEQAGRDNSFFNFYNVPLEVIKKRPLKH